MNSHLPICISLLFLTAFFSTPTTLATPTDPVETLRHKFSDYSVQRQGDEELCKHSALSTSPRLCEWYRAKSVEPLKRDGSEGRFFLRFTFRVLEYESASASLTALNSLKKAADPDWGLDKAWSYVSADGQKLYWLSAGCLYSMERWGELKARFFGSLIEDDRRTAFECRCGGACGEE